MDLRRARTWEWLGGLFGAVLIVALFLDWYGCGGGTAATSAGAGCRVGASVSGWGAFAVAHLVMLVAGAIALVALVLTLVQRTPAVPLALTSVGAAFALVAAVVALIRLVSPPDLPGIGEYPVRLLGAWLGAGSALALTGVMLASIRDERIPSAVRGVDGASPEPTLLTLSGSGSSRPAPRRAGPPEGAA
jgi:hypothetical protein